ncbi:hypothetical protein HZA98_04110 [Candidatus Woesearchaeota archaeon]|nr:hypothetical protein [Candidatus Woesearchaeota archaeon]
MGYSDQTMLETEDGCIFTSIGNMHPVGISLGLIVYIPWEEELQTVPHIKRTAIKERSYAKITPVWHFTSRRAYFDCLKKYAHYIYEDPLFGKVTAIPDRAVMQSYLPQWDISLELEKILEEACFCLEIPKEATRITGSPLFTQKNGNDVDIAIYGRKHVQKAVERIRELTKIPQYQFIRYGRIHQKLFCLGKHVIDIFPLYSQEDMPPFPQKVEYQGQVLVQGEVAEEFDAAFTPSTYLLHDGKLLLSYQIGHKLLLRKGDKVEVNAHKICFPETKQEAFLIRLGDPWEDPTLEKRFPK